MIASNVTLGTMLVLLNALTPLIGRAAHPTNHRRHLHLGHVHHNNTSSEREDIWHASTAVVRQIGDALKLVPDLGLDTNTDRTVKVDPVFLIAGFIYSPHRDVDIDVGYKTASTDSLRTRTLLTGLTLRW